MFVTGEANINTRLKNISLNVETNMHPKNEKPPVCPRGQLPQLHLTPSGGGQKRPEGETPTGANNPCLLKPQHEIPSTPPPQPVSQPLEFFPQRIG